MIIATRDLQVWPEAKTSKNTRAAFAIVIRLFIGLFPFLLTSWIRATTLNANVGLVADRDIPATRKLWASRLALPVDAQDAVAGDTKSGCFVVNAHFNGGIRCYWNEILLEEGVAGRRCCWKFNKGGVKSWDFLHFESGWLEQHPCLAKEVCYIARQ